MPIPGRAVPAVGAGTTGVAGIHDDDAPTSFFRFVRDHRQELSPPGIVDGSVESGLGGCPVGCVASFAIGAGFGSSDHVLDVEVFVDDDVVVVDESSRELMQGVGAAVADVAMCGADTLTGLVTPRGTLHFGVDSPLRGGEALGTASRMRWVDQQLAVTARNQHPDAQVDPHLTACRRERRSGHIGAADRYPPAPPFSLNSDRLRRAPHRAVEAHPHATHTTEMQPPGRSVETPPVAVFPLQRIETPRRLEARIAGSLALPAAGKERLKGPIQPQQRSARQRHARRGDHRIDGPQRRQGPTLLFIAD